MQIGKTNIQADSYRNITLVIAYYTVGLIVIVYVGYHNVHVRRL